MSMRLSMQSASAVSEKLPLHSAQPSEFGSTARGFHEGSPVENPLSSISIAPQKKSMKKAFFQKELEQVLAPKKLQQKSNLPDPQNHQHAIFTLSVLGFSAQESGNWVGDGELFAMLDGFPRSSVESAGDGEEVEVREPMPFVMAPHAVDTRTGKLRISMELKDEDVASNNLLTSFELLHDLDSFHNQPEQHLTLRSLQDDATLKISVRRDTIRPDQLSEAS